MKIKCHYIFWLLQVGIPIEKSDWIRVLTNVTRLNTFANEWGPTISFFNCMQTTPAEEVMARVLPTRRHCVQRITKVLRQIEFDSNDMTKKVLQYSWEMTTMACKLGLMAFYFNSLSCIERVTWRANSQTQWRMRSPLYFTWFCMEYFLYRLQKEYEFHAWIWKPCKLA